VVTGPLYLWAHLDGSEQRLGGGLGDHSPEHAATDYRRLVRAIAAKHLLDMLVASGARLDDALAKVLARQPGLAVGGAAALSHYAVPPLAAAVSLALVAVAKDHSQAGMADGTGHGRSGFGHAINGNRGRHPLWWSSSGAFRDVSAQWLGAVLASYQPSVAAGGSRFEDPGAAAEALRLHVRRAVDTHRDTALRQRRVESAFRTPEAAEAMLLRPQVSFGPISAADAPAATAGAHSGPSSSSHRKLDASPERQASGAGPLSWLSPLIARNARHGISGDGEDDVEDSGVGVGGSGEGGGLQQDRMCYFIIGNLHRLRAELRDRGLLARGGVGDPAAPAPGAAVITVGTVVRALQVAASCPYPASGLAALLAAAVDPRSGAPGGGGAAFLSPVRVHDGGIWDLPVNLSNLEAQLDDHLMRM
jgi:hypothetical protein